jgi:large subunit ribosomal protein L24
MVARIKTKDTVLVCVGKDKGKQGTVIDICRDKGVVKVKGINLVTRHIKARKANDVPGIKKEEGYINISNVMPVCSSCKKACRATTVTLADGGRSRSCGRCKEVF